MEKCLKVTKNLGHGHVLQLSDGKEFFYAYDTVNIPVGESYRFSCKKLNSGWRDMNVIKIDTVNVIL